MDSIRRSHALTEPEGVKAGYILPVVSLLVVVTVDIYVSLVLFLRTIESYILFGLSLDYLCIINYIIFRISYILCI